MNALTLRQLRYFEALARHRHFGRAAEACAISQPGLSMQIRDLELTLGTALFERGARQVRLTGFGLQLLPRAREILQAVEAMQDLARAAQGRLAGPLRLGVIPTIAPYMLPGIAAAISRQHPGLELHLRETLTHKLIEELAEARLDAAIVALPVSEPSLTEVALFDEAFVLVRPAADAARPVPDHQALARMRLLLLEEGHCFRDQALSFCTGAQARPRDMLDASSLATLVQMVAAGMGVTLIPEMAVAVETRAAAVSVARFAAPQPARTVGMVWRKTSPMAERFLQLAEVIRQAAALQRAAGARRAPEVRP